MSFTALVASRATSRDAMAALMASAATTMPTINSINMAPDAADRRRGSRLHMSEMADQAGGACGAGHREFEGVSIAGVPAHHHAQRAPGLRGGDVPHVEHRGLPPSPGP